MSLSLLIVAIVAAIGFFQLGALTVWTMVLALAIHVVVGIVVVAATFGLGYLAWRRYRLRAPKEPEADASRPTIIMP